MNDPGDEDDGDQRVRDLAAYIQRELANPLRPFVATPMSRAGFMFEALAMPLPQIFLVLNLVGPRVDHDGGDEDDTPYTLLGAPLRVAYGRT